MNVSVDYMWLYSRALLVSNRREVSVTVSAECYELKDS